MPLPTHRPWAALLALLGVLFVAGSAGPLPQTLADFGHLCSAQGASQPDRSDPADQHERCLLCPAGHLVGHLPETAAAPASPGAIAIALIPAARDVGPERVAGVVQARAPPSV